MNFFVTACTMTILACSLSANAETAIPKVVGMPYDIARAEMMKAGWQPAKNLKQDVNDVYANDFRTDNGFTEVKSCSDSGLLRCAFIFTDSTSPAQIRLVTGGEGMPRVDDVQIRRPKPAEPAAATVKSAKLPPADKKPAQPIEAVVNPESTNDVQARCTKISKQYQAAAMFREKGISEEEALAYMEHLKTVDDRQPMQIAVMGAYEVYTAYDSEQIKVVSYRKCLIDNNVPL
ncbi:hypothetical protein [Pseudomonas sp. MHK4]